MYFLIRDLLRQRSPDFVVLEGVQFQNNYKTYSQLSQMQGIVFSILFELDIGFCIIEPNSWRKFVDVKGRKRVEQKAAAIEKVKEVFGIDAEEDVAEAICIGLWGVNNVGKKEGKNNG